MSELAVLLALAYVGVLAAGRCGVERPSALLALALPLGVAVHVPLLLVPLLVGLPVAPRAALAAAVVVLTAVTVRRRPAVLGWAFAAAGLYGAAAWLALQVTFARVTPDSFRYLEAAGILRDFRSLEPLTAHLALTRQFTYPAVQALAEPGGYLRTFSLLALLGAVAVVLVAANQTLGAAAPPPAVQAVVLVAALAPNRVAFHALYLNGHTLAAALLAVLGATAWIAWRRPDAVRAWWGPATLATVALVPLRPEAVLVTGITLLPFVFAPAVPLAWRRAPLLALGVTTLVWYLGGPLRLALLEGGSPDASVLLATALGAATLIVALVPGLIALRWVTVRRLVVGALVAALAAFAVLRTDEVEASLRATAENLTRAGHWGWFWPVVVVLLALAWRSRPAAWGILVWPLATFPALGLLLALLRGKPYRVGPGDSFSRMLMHLVPLLALALLARLERSAATSDVASDLDADAVSDDASDLNSDAVSDDASDGSSPASAVVASSHRPDRPPDAAG
jgi:hypothetical protein